MMVLGAFNSDLMVQINILASVLYFLYKCVNTITFKIVTEVVELFLL